MKLVELAKDAIKLLKLAGTEGILNLNLAKKLNMPRRRIYDIIAILKAAKLVETSRKKNGTQITWVGLSPRTSKVSHSSRDSYESSDDPNVTRTKDSFNQKFPFQNTTKVKSFSDSTAISGISINSSTLRIRSASKITKITPIGVMELLVKCDSPGFIIETQSDKNRKVNEVEQAVVDAR